MTKGYSSDLRAATAQVVHPAALGCRRIAAQRAVGQTWAAAAAVVHPAALGCRRIAAQRAVGQTWDAGTTIDADVVHPAAVACRIARSACSWSVLG